MIRFTGIHHVQVAMPPGQEEAARAFYSGVLGLAEIPKPRTLTSRGGCWFRGQNVELHIGADKDFTPARKAHPALVVEGLDELERRLQGDGRDVSRDVELIGFRRFYASDPFGNRLEFVEPK